MTVIPVGFPDGQDPLSFVAGNAGPVVGPFDLDPGEGVATVVPPGGLTSTTLWLIDGAAGLYVDVETTTPSGGDVVPQSTQVILPASGRMVLPAVQLGGGYLVTLGNPSGVAMTGQGASAFNLFRTSYENAYAQRFPRHLQGNGVLAGGSRSLASRGYEGQYDHLTLLVTADGKFDVKVRWFDVTGSLSTLTTITITETLGQTVAGMPLRLERDVVGLSAIVDVINADASPKSFDLLAHFYRLS